MLFDCLLCAAHCFRGLICICISSFITVIMLGEPLTETAHSLWPRSTVTTCMSCPTVVRNVEPIELPPTERIQQRSEGESRCQSIYPSVCVCVCMLSFQLSPTLCDPTDGSLPYSSVHGILQATILEGVAVSLYVSCIGRQVLYHYVLPTSQTPSRWNPSWLRNPCATRKDPESEWLARDNLETNPITVKAKTVSQVAEQFSWVPLSCCSPPRCPFPVSSLTLSAPVSPWNICARVLDKSPVLGHGRVSLFMQR